MAQFEQTLEQLETFTPEEPRRLQDGIIRLLQSGNLSDDLLREKAKERGIVITSPTETISDEEYDRFEPMPILRGEPVSETILKERR